MAGRVHRDGGTERGHGGHVQPRRLHHGRRRQGDLHLHRAGRPEPPRDRHHPGHGDDRDEQATIDVTKDWVDTTPPVAACVESVNPDGHIPASPGNGGQHQNPDGFSTAPDPRRVARGGPRDLVSTPARPRLRTVHVRHDPHGSRPTGRSRARSPATARSSGSSRDAATPRSTPSTVPATRATRCPAGCRRPRPDPQTAAA